MPHYRASAVALLLPLLFSPVFAEDAKLVGCDAVGCPVSGSSDRCTVESNTFIGVGVSHIPNAPSELESFSLVKAVSVSTSSPQANDSMARPFRSFYYLGAPENTKADELSGCAVVFNNPPVQKFKTSNGTDTFAATGTCSDVLPQSCIDKITQRAKDAVNGATGNSNACNALEQEMKKDDFSGCASFGGQGTSLGNFTIQSIGNLHAVKNSTDCWPVQRKSDGLMQIAEVVSNGSSSKVEDFYNEAYKITPVVTVFLGGNTSLVHSTSSQMTCLKLVSRQHYPAGAPTNSATTLGGSWLVSGVLGLVAVFAAL